jgi:hypothetical protein
MVKLGWSEKFLIPTNEESGTLLVALGNAIKVSETTKANITTFKQEDSNIELSFINNPRFDETSPIENELLTKLQAAESRWLEYYQKEQAATKRAKEAEEKLAKLTSTVQAATAPEVKEDVPF